MITGQIDAVDGAPTAATTTPDAESVRDAEGRFRDSWKTTFASTVGLTFGPSCVLIFCFGTFVPALEREFGWGIGAISVGATLINTMLILASLAAGFLSDRIGVRRLVLWSMPLFAASVAALSLLQSDIRGFYVGLAGAALLGMGIWPVAYNKATAAWFDRRLGLSLGLANAGIGLGAALLPALVGLTIANHGWRAGYLLLGVLAVALPWPLAFAMLREPKKGAGRTVGAAAATGAGLGFADARRTREFWLALGGFFVLGAASSSLIVHLIRILIDTGMTAAQATALQSTLGLALIVGRVGTGWVLDRLRVSIVLVVLCLAAALALVLLAVGAPFGTGVLCAVLLGLVIGAEFDVLGFLIPRYFGRRAFGTIYGTVFAVFQIASALAIGLLGGWRGAHGTYFGGLCVMAAMLVLGAVVFARLGTYRYPAGSA